MIRLKQLLFEKTASEEAKEYGLQHIGFGRYVVPNMNKVVAKSEKGKLVWTKPNVKNSIQKGKEIKAMKTRQKEKTAERQANPMKRTKLDVNKEEYKGNIAPSSVPLPKGFKARRVKTANGVLFDDFNTDNDPNEMIEPIMDGEEIVFWDAYGWDIVNGGTITPEQRKAFMDAWYYWSEGPHGMHDVPDPLSPEIRAIERNEFKSNAEGHWEGVKLFSRLDPKTLNDFMRVLTRWQVGPQFIVDSKERRLERNRFINKILAGDDPKKDAATVDVTFPLERGMDMDADTAREFLSQFEIGKTLTLPPCGYSMSPQQARQCASINIPRHGLENPEQLAVGLLLRVHSRGEISALKGDDYGEAGTIIGYPLSNKRRALNEYMEKHPEVEKGEFEASDRNYIVHHMDPYDDEAEVIRPGFAAQKVTKITKHVFPLRNEGDSRIMAARVLYVIDMTEQGIVDDPKQIAEVKSIITPIKKFYNYLNTTVARRRLKRELKKRGRSLSKVRSKRK